MSLHLSLGKAWVAAGQLEVEANKKARTRNHSSGWSYKRYGVRKRFLVFWEPYEK